ncbi:hypothetical protein [Streptomyces bauhiniae]|uniref:LppX_LprAFG lipoprotein n=1 Tax=Streptomyces bauhiniae TaxID=2340725 RepID=A0A7K3QM24_9ACTN|nr:hypothetical protein [Streptomyces bauhiniae]
MTAIFQAHTWRAARTARVTALCVLAVSALTLLTGCGEEDPDAGTNGVGRLPARQIQTQSRAAADAAPAVHLAGSVVTGGVAFKLDMRLKSGGGSGSVTSKDSTFQLLRVGDELYVKADAAFWNHGGDTSAAGKLDGKYVKVPQKDPAYQKFSGFTEKDVLLPALLTLHGELATAGHHTQAGTRTIRVTGDGGLGGTLDVSLEGKPYPLRLVRGGGAGTLTFSEWGKDFAAAEPDKTDTVDYGGQLPGS